VAFDGIAAGPLTLVLASSPRPPGLSKVESMAVRSRSFGQLQGDHCEGQFEGQNGAGGRLSEPVSACVS